MSLKQKFLTAVFTAAVLFFSCNEPPDDFDYNNNDTWETITPLRDTYEKYFLMGNIISPGDLNNTTRLGILKRHYNVVTAENHMKPDNLAPSRNGEPYKWAAADTIVKWAQEEDKQVHGHTLVWHKQTPQWLNLSSDPEVVLKNMEDYITTVVTHFKGKLISWDVVNEAFRDGLKPNDVKNWKNALRETDSRWKKVIGPEYIEKAFLAARKADTDAILFYNDYNLNSVEKSTAVYNMVKDINERYPNVNGRKLIDGIGMQSHHHIGTSVGSVETAIKLFISLGVEITISELDILEKTTNDNNPLTDELAQKQANQYRAMFRVFMKYSDHISRVTFWGLDDGTSWRAPAYHPTLMYKDYGLKPAFYAVSSP
jgi:endo-1,4-beta-xylanase